MQHAISIAGSHEANHYAVIDREELRQRALDQLQMIVLNAIQQGDPQTCSAFADYCSERLDGEVTLALCLSHINRDTGLQSQAMAQLRAHVDKCQPNFVAAEVEHLIARDEAAAEAQALASLELDHA